MQLRTRTETSAEARAARPAGGADGRGKRGLVGGGHGAETQVTGSGLQWITARIPQALVRRLEAHAKVSGTNRSDAIRECLEIGMEAVEVRQGVPEGRVDDILARLDTTLLALDVIGPSTMGVLRLLAHWAAQDGSVKVGEDDLVTEVRAVGSEEWDQLISEGQPLVDSPAPPPPDEER